MVAEQAERRIILIVGHVIHRYRFIVRWCVAFVLAAMPVIAVASGWNDFDLPIDANHHIVRCNTFEIVLTGISGVIYMPEHGGRTGPITGYVVSGSHILLKTTGQKPRNSFAGDTYVYSDPSVEYYFVVDKFNDKLRGPLTLSEFTNDPDVAAFGAMNWVVPKNPHPERALIGSLMFVAFTAAIFGGPLLLIILAVVGIVILVRPKRAVMKRVGEMASEMQNNGSCHPRCPQSPVRGDNANGG